MMNSWKFLLALTLIGLCCVDYAHSIKCYTCDSPKDCKKAGKTVECTAKLAEETIAYLDFHYVNVTKEKSATYECLKDSLESNTGNFMHKGCIYSNVRSCNYAIKPIHQKPKRACSQCGNKDGCNPANRASVNPIVLMATITAVLAMCKFMTRN